MFFDQDFRERDDVGGLGVKEADGLDVVFEALFASFSIFSGVSTILNSGPVALLTPTSVAWADSTTATSSV